MRREDFMVRNDSPFRKAHHQAAHPMVVDHVRHGRHPHTGEVYDGTAHAALMLPEPPTNPRPATESESLAPSDVHHDEPFLQRMKAAARRLLGLGE